MTYYSITELRDAVTEAGYRCPHWTEGYVGGCRRAGVLHRRGSLTIYTGHAVMLKRLRSYEADDEEMIKEGVGADPRVFGANWIVLTDHDSALLVKKLGGTLVKLPPN